MKEESKVYTFRTKNGRTGFAEIFYSKEAVGIWGDGVGPATSMSPDILSFESIFKLAELTNANPIWRQLAGEIRASTIPLLVNTN